MLSWIIAICSLIGVVLNIKKHRSSFAIWFFTNIYWSFVGFNNRLPAQGVLFLIYSILAVVGWISWGKEWKTLK